MDILTYKGYEGSAVLDMDRGICRGKILLIDDLVTYEHPEPKKLQKEFEDAVDDYLETCKQLGREAQVPLKGQFNVRISPALHKDLVVRAAKDEVSLNEIVSRACTAYVCQKDVNHNHKFVLTLKDESRMVTGIASMGAPLQWVQGAADVRH
jgi:predicted HicB family RNase H-like nuclease